MVERASETTVKILFLAQEEARSLGDARLGTEHILMALLSFDNAACCALAGFGVSYDDVRLEIEEVRSEQNALAVEAEIEFSERAGRCLELAYLESLSLKHAQVGPEHILLAMVRLGQGVAIGILSKLAVSMVDLEVALLYQCSSALAAPQEDVAAELLTQIEVWKRLAAIAVKQGYDDLALSAAKHTRMYRDALMELEATMLATAGDGIPRSEPAARDPAGGSEIISE